MKKVFKGLIAGAAGFGLLAFTGCDFIMDMLEAAGETEHGYEIVKATENESWNYDSSYPLYAIDPSVKSVTVNNIPAGKKMYLVKRNISEGETVDKNDTRSILSGYYRSAVSSENEIPQIEIEETGFKHFVAPDFPKLSPVSSRAAVSAPLQSVTPISGTTGTKKEIWVELANGYVKKSATLRAVGTYCYVWVIDDYYSTASKGNKVDSSKAQDYASNFDTVYPYIRNIFGEESEQIINLKTNRYESISSLSDTGSKVNIVVYDIKNDGVLGFFFSKDYYYSDSGYIADGSGKKHYINPGKYFYIDSVYANSNFKDTVSTLAHEFQHMINFNQKNLNEDCVKNPSVGYNEMLSMLCEDLMQSKLGLKDSESPKNRLKNFNEAYYLAALTGYEDSKNTALYYATNYAFGAWLARQYGGAKLVKAMSTNSYVDCDSIEEAVNEVNGTNYSIDDLFEQFFLALTGSSTYTLNKSAAQSVVYSGYSYPMTAINLWDSSYGFSELASTLSSVKYFDEDWRGPFNFSSAMLCELKPENGISIHCLGPTTAGSRKLEFSDGADCLPMYLIIQ